MTPARRTARTLRGIALISTASGLYASAHQPAYLLPGLTGAAVLLVVAVSFDRDDQRTRARHRALSLAALEDETVLAATAPCCRFWEVPDGAHQPDCPTTTRSAA